MKIVILPNIDRTIMAQILKSEKAKSLRRRGLSIGEIATLVQVGKSTVSYWCRDIVLTSKQISNISARQKSKSLKALNIYVERLRKDRLQRVRAAGMQGRRDVGKLSKRDLFIVGLGLYWAEGYKKGNSELGFTNSDPAIIKLMIKWLKTVYGIKNEDFILRVSINNLHEARIKEITKFWARVTNLPKSQFTKASLIKSVSKKVYLNSEHHFGTLRVKVRRGYNLRYRILGSLDALKDFGYIR